MYALPAGPVKAPGGIHGGTVGTAVHAGFRATTGPRPSWRANAGEGAAGAELDRSRRSSHDTNHDEHAHLVLRVLYVSPRAAGSRGEACIGTRVTGTARRSKVPRSSKSRAAIFLYQHRGWSST